MGQLTNGQNTWEPAKGKEEVEREGKRQADDSGESDEERPVTQDEVQTGPLNSEPSL